MDSILYKKFKVCLLLMDMSIKDFSDQYTNTSPQHVTMVVQGKKNSSHVLQQVYEFIDNCLAKSDTRKFIKELTSDAEKVKGGGAIDRPKEVGNGYDW